MTPKSGWLEDTQVAESEAHTEAGPNEQLAERTADSAN
jgi:hypothetical protein